jgi:hypothetical protein
MVELKGSLSGIGLPAIVQLIGELRHSGSLELSKGSARGVLDFDDGRLVAADFTHESGLVALATLSLDMAEGEFNFVEGVPVHERTLDLTSKDVQAYLKRVASGENIAVGAEPPPAERDSSPELGACPLLGFADDRARHYSRATALHRCFASGAPSLVTGLEQRELCLGGRYPTCPRYRNASPVNATAVPSSADATLVALPPAPVYVPPTPPVPGPPAAMPPGVAARMAVASSMHMPPSASNSDVPTWIGHDRNEPHASTDAPPAAPRGPYGFRRAMLLIGSGVVLGLIILVVIMLVSMTSLNGGLTAQKPTVAGAQAFGPVATTTRAPVQATNGPAVAASTAASPTALSRPSTPVSRASIPTALPRPLPAPPGVGGQSLLDVRFASGGGAGWLENPPFAAWTDGAYRLQVRQAARFVAVGAPVDRLLGDVLVSGTFRKTGGPPGGGYGLLVRDQGPAPRDGTNQTMNAYVLEAGDLGEFGVWRRAGDHWVDLMPWTRSTSVRPGGSPNELAVRAIGTRLTFSINGTEVASIDDDTLSDGRVGVFIGGDYNEVALDRFSVLLPD